ncbi:NAD-glutamate dehydrogenase [Micromonospora sp. ATA32]|nr:NAD-glutamate dehydrogenase [Micromonospora sp. ATA32]
MAQGAAAALALADELAAGPTPDKPAAGAGGPPRGRRGARPLRAEPGQPLRQAPFRFKVYRYAEPMMLSAVLPVLHLLGAKVVDEHTYEVDRVDGWVFLYNLGLQPPVGHQDRAEVRPACGEAFALRRVQDGPHAIRSCRRRGPSSRSSSTPPVRRRAPAVLAIDEHQRPGRRGSR